MKIPISWLKEYTKVPKTNDLTNKLTLAGHMLDKTEKYSNETVIDLELRGNRADCYSILGIAKETSALFNTNLKSPKLYKKLPKTKSLPEVSLSIDTQFVKRVMMITVKDVKITNSPEWLKKRLTLYGIPSINNIVDLTNYVMIETGQPMHAFDLDKLNQKLQIRLAKNKEKMVTFLDQTLSLTNEDLVWSMGNTVLSIAGAIGGKERSISPETKNILLEAATYDRANIRRSIHHHNLFTEAGIRHEKDLDPNLVEIGVYRFLELINQNNWGKISTKIFDYYPKPVKPWKISLNLEYLKKLSGLQIEIKQTKKILENLGFKIAKSTSQNIQLICPTSRTDVTTQEDIIEEILRITGYNKVPQKILSLEIPKNITSEDVLQENRFKETATKIGFNEVITIPFVEQKLISLNQNLLEEKTQAIKVQNKPSPDLETMRTSLLPNLIGITKKVIDERGTESRIFEIGKVYFQINKKYYEKRRLALAYWKESSTSFSTFKGFLESIFEITNIPKISFLQTNILSHSITHQFEITSEKIIIGRGGLYKNIFYFEIDLEAILGKDRIQSVSLWPKYPPQIEDITLTIPSKTYIGNLIDFALQAQEEISKIDLVDVYKRNYTFKIYYQSKSHTLTNVEVEKIREKLLNKLSKKFNTTTV